LWTQITAAAASRIARETLARMHEALRQVAIETVITRRIRFCY
jgi:hypothetical protein